MLSETSDDTTATYRPSLAPAGFLATLAYSRKQTGHAAHNGQVNWPVLAGVRFALALIVASTHFAMVGGEQDPFFALNAFGGVAAVLGFLVISGFSIAHSYAVQPRQFFVRRFARIYPLYLTCILAWWLFFQVAGLSIVTLPTGVEIDAPTTWQTLQNAVMLQGVSTIAAFSPAWSLSVECWFYAATPLLFLCRPNVLRFLALASCAFWFFIEPLSLTTLSTLRFGLAAVTVGWAWLLGFIVYSNRLRWLDLIFLIAAGVVLLSRYTGGYQPLSIVTYLGVCAALIFGPRLQLSSRTNAILNYLGDLSYPLYLSHVPVLFFTVGYLHLVHSLIAAIVVLLVSVALLHFVDRPLHARLLSLKPRIDRVRTAWWALIGLGFCGVATLAYFTGVRELWLVAIVIAVCTTFGAFAKPKWARIPALSASIAGYVLTLGCALFPQWTAYALGAPLPTSVNLHDPSSSRFVHNFQDDWVVGHQAEIYLSVPDGNSVVNLNIVSSVPAFLAQQVVHVSAGACALGTYLPQASSVATRLMVPSDCANGSRISVVLRMEQALLPPGTSDVRHLSLRVDNVSLLRGP